MNKTKELKKQQKVWYKKLKESGFEDIEYFDKDMEPKHLLRGGSKFSPLTNEQENSMNYSSVGILNEYEATVSYYDKARSLLHTIPFKNEQERLIWEMYSEGEAVRKIGKVVGFSHPKVLKIIKQIKESL